MKSDVIDYDGMIGCVTLSNNEVFLTRRNGRCAWQGNSAITQKISFANSVGELCDHIPNADAHAVCKAIGMDSRIGRKYLTPATKYSGECFPRDNRAVSACAKQYGCLMPLAAATQMVNVRQIGRIITAVESVRPQRLAVLGLAFKPDTYVTTESIGMELADVMRLVCSVAVHDPKAHGGVNGTERFEDVDEAVRDADVVAITTPWPEYKLLRPKDFKQGATVIDCWAILDPVEFKDSGVKLVVPGKGPTK